MVAVATTLFVAVATFAAITGTCALALAAWHLRHREMPSKETSDGARRSSSARHENLARSSR